jgi:hypothetical protein
MKRRKFSANVEFLMRKYRLFYFFFRVCLLITFGFWFLVAWEVYGIMIAEALSLTILGGRIIALCCAIAVCAVVEYFWGDVRGKL